MKKGIIFFLLGLFMLFTLKGISNYNLQFQNGIHKITEHHHSKRNAYPTTVKSSTQQDENSEYFYPEFDDDFQISDAANVLISACVLGFCGLLITYYKKQKLLPYHFYEEIFSVKRFILIRSLRI